MGVYRLVGPLGDYSDVCLVILVWIFIISPWAGLTELVVSCCLLGECSYGFSLTGSKCTPW